MESNRGVENKKNKVIVICGWILLYIYIFVLSYFLFFSEYYGRLEEVADYRYNLVLFKEIKRFIRFRESLGIESFVVNIFGNILAFSPLGFMLSLLKENYGKLISIFLISFGFSLSIEILQLIFKVGIFDVDDIFLNTLGGLLGYLFSIPVKKIFKRSKNKV